MLLAGFGEYLAQMNGGIAISQGEVVRPSDLGIGVAEMMKFQDAVKELIAAGTDVAVRLRIAESIKHSAFGELGLDETLCHGLRTVPALLHG